MLPTSLKRRLRGFTSIIPFPDHGFWPDALIWRRDRRLNCGPKSGMGCDAKGACSSKETPLSANFVLLGEPIDGLPPARCARVIQRAST
jgi:hypothetical protein